MLLRFSDLCFLLKKCAKVLHDVQFLQFSFKKSKNTFIRTSQNLKKPKKNYWFSMIFQNALFLGFFIFLHLWDMIFAQKFLQIIDF